MERTGAFWILWIVAATAGAQDPAAGGAFVERRIAELPEVELAAVSVGPGGRRVAWLTRQGVPSIDGVEGRAFLGWPMPVASPAVPGAGPFFWSPDGAHVAWFGTRDRKDFLAVDGRETPLYDRFCSVAFSADWSRTAYIAEEGKDRRLVVDGKTLEHGQDEIGRAVVWSADGRRLAYTARRAGAWRAVVDGMPLEDGSDLPVFSPDGRRTAYVLRAGPDAHVVVDDRKGPRFDSAGRPLFSPDGRRIAYVARLGKAHHVVLDGTPGPAFEDIDDRTLVFSADGKHLAYAADRQLILDGVPRLRTAPLLRLHLSPDGRRWAVARPSSQLSGLELVVDGEILYAYLRDPVFSPSGRHVAYVGGTKDDGFLGVNRFRMPVKGEVLGDPVFSADEKKVAFAARAGRDVLWKVEDVLDALGPGEPAAVRELSRLRELFGKAASYRVLTTSEQADGKNPPVKSSAAVLVKGGRVKITHDERPWLISDGATAAIATGGTTPAWTHVPVQNLRKSLDEAFGHGVPLMMWLYAGGTPEAVEVLPLPDRDGMKGLAYRVLFRDTGRTFKARVWVEATSGRPRRRELETGMELGYARITETIEAFEPGVEPPDEEFRLPPER